MKEEEVGGGCHNCCKPTLPHLCLTVEEHRGKVCSFLAHKGKKEIHPYLNILIDKCLAIRPRGTKIKETDLKRRK